MMWSAAAGELSVCCHVREQISLAGRGAHDARRTPAVRTASRAMSPHGQPPGAQVERAAACADT